MARRGRRGEGSVYFSKTDRRWVARFPLGVVDGVRQAKRIKCRTRDEADAELDKLRRTYGAGLDPATGTLDEYLDAWLKRHGRSIRASTQTSYAGHIRLHIKPLLGGIPLAKLRRSDVERLVDDLEGKGLSPGTIHLVVRTLSVALAAADIDIVRRVKLPRIEREPVDALTESEVERIYAAVLGTWLELPVRVWMGSGLRRGEVLGLDQRDVGDGFVTVRRSKTTVRAVPVTEDAMDALREAVRLAPRHGPNEPVFYGKKSGDRMPGSSVTHALVKLVGLSPHKLRHGVASRMVAQGVHMRVVAEQLGHRNPALTARVYAHIVPQHQVDAIRLLERRQAR
jgi:integrase